MAKRYRHLIIWLAGCLTIASSGAAAEHGIEPNPVDRPLVMIIFDHGCKKWCEQVRPVIRQLEQQYKGRVSFVELDVSLSSRKESRKVAERLGLARRFDDMTDYAPAVYACTGKHNWSRELIGPKSKSTYATVIDQALSQTHQ